MKQTLSSKRTPIYFQIISNENSDRECLTRHPFAPAIYWQCQMNIAVYAITIRRFFFLRAIYSGHPGSMASPRAASIECVTGQVLPLVLQAETRLSCNDGWHYVRAADDGLVHAGRKRRVAEVVFAQ